MRAMIPLVLLLLVACAQTNVAGDAKASSCPDSRTLYDGETVTTKLGGADYEITAHFIGTDARGNAAVLSVNGERSAPLHAGESFGFSRGVITMLAVPDTTQARYCFDHKKQCTQCATLPACPMVSRVEDMLRGGETRIYTIDGTDYEVRPFLREGTLVNYSVNGNHVGVPLGETRNVLDVRLTTQAVLWDDVDALNTLYTAFCLGK